MLSQHPQLWSPPFKEVQFFNHLYIEEHRKWLPWHFRRGKLNIEKGYDSRKEQMPKAVANYLDRVTREPMFTNHWYKCVFAPAPEGTTPVDITPEYSTLPEEGVIFAAKFLREAKFIYILRHPVDRAVSQLKMNLTRAGRRPKTLDDWMQEIQDPVLLDRGDYAQYVPRWKKHVSEDRLLILPFGRIATDPLSLLREVEDFAGLGPWDYRNMGAKVFASTTDLSLPFEARAALRAKLEPQMQFLRQHFGDEFMQQIR